jgi:type II secretory ATPase GspE/PulE/Tfp pilus assembly ATPase PilB-like protein
MSAGRSLADMLQAVKPRPVADVALPSAAAPTPPVRPVHGAGSNLAPKIETARAPIGVAAAAVAVLPTAGLTDPRPAAGRPGEVEPQEPAVTQSDGARWCAVKERNGLVLIRPLGRAGDLDEALAMAGVRANYRREISKLAGGGGAWQNTVQTFGFASPEQIARALAALGQREYCPWTNVEAMVAADVEPFADKIEPSSEFIPIGFDSRGHLIVAISRNSAANAANNLGAAVQAPVRLVYASQTTITLAYRRFYARSAEAFDAALAEYSIAEDGDIFKVLGALLQHACYQQASDIHIWPQGEFRTVRLMIAGTGQIFRVLNRQAGDRLLSSFITTFGNPDTLRAQPQDRTINLRDAHSAAPQLLQHYPHIAQRYTFRLAFAERTDKARTVTARVLDNASEEGDFETLGFDDYTKAALLRITDLSDGLVLVTGPTGSGKTTTLYALMRQIDAIARPVQTIENPIERPIGLFQQYDLPPNVEEGSGFQMMAKLLLRNAPKVVLLGEMRDSGVANVAVDMSMTGHLTFGTLHANNAATTVARLYELLSDPTKVGDSLRAVLSQRLLRTLCPHCKVPDLRRTSVDIVKAREFASLLRGQEARLYQASEAGCLHCGWTGYKGRALIYELLEVDTKLADRIRAKDRTFSAVHDALEGRSMFACGLKVVIEGRSSIDELSRTASRGGD